MIRINLLAVERERAKAARVLISPAQRVTLAASVVLLATFVGIGWWFWSLRQESQRLDQDLARAESEVQQLRAVLAQVQKFEARKGQLQQRVTLIEQLRKGQYAPVHVLDQVSRSLPDRLWLGEMKQKDADFTISGFSTSLTAVSDFVANLEATGRFKRPVEILDSQLMSNEKTGDLVKFSIKATYSDPDAAPAPPPAVAPATRPGTARGSR